MFVAATSVYSKSNQSIEGQNNKWGSSSPTKSFKERQ